MLKNRNVQQRNQGLIRRTRSSSGIDIPLGDGRHQPNNENNNAPSSFGYRLTRQKSNDSNTMRQLYYHANHMIHEQQFVPPDQWKVIGGFVIMILMMILMMSLDFQVDDEIDIDWINRNILPVQIKYYHMNDSQFCFYDGNCGYGSTCSIRKEFLVNINKSFSSSDSNNNNNNSSLTYPGICEPIKIPFNNIVMNMLKSVTPSSSKKKKNDDSLLSLSCISSCQKELELDEYYYYNSTTTIIWTKDNIKSIGRPIGCLLVLNRTSTNNQIKTTDTKNDIIEKQQQYELWMKQKTRNNIIRIDPLHIFSDQFLFNQFIVYCYRSCMIDNDCHTLHDNNNTNTNTNKLSTAYVCLSGVCQKNSKIWKQQNQQQVDTKSKPNKKKKIMTGDNDVDDDTTSVNNNNDNTENIKYYYGNHLYIISYGNYKNFHQLKQFVIYVNKYAPFTKIIIYNINYDMSYEQINEIYTWNNIHSIEWIDNNNNNNNNNNLPHFPTISNTSELISNDINNNNNNDQMNNNNMIEMDHYIRKKSYIINETLYHYKYIIWFDPETILHGSIYPIEEIIQRTGIFLSSSSSSSILEGYLYPSRYIDSIIIPNALCSINVSCIIPSSPLYNVMNNNSSSHTNYYYYHDELQIPYHTEYTTTTKKSSKMILTDDPEYQEEVLGDDDHIRQEQKMAKQHKKNVIWTMNHRHESEEE